MSAEYVTNPFTGRKVKVGGRKYRDLINTGAIAEEFESGSDISLQDLDWKKAGEEVEDIQEEITDDEMEEKTESRFFVENEISDFDDNESSEDNDGFADLDETDLEKISEYVNYIRSNKK